MTDTQVLNRHVFGLPDSIVHDAGKLKRRDFQGNTDMIYTPRMYIPVKAAQEMSLVEQQFQPLRHAFHITTKATPDTGIGDASHKQLWRRLATP